MAHYALLDENNIVVQVITGRNEHEVVDGITDWEEFYSKETGYRCLRTSYNTYANQHKNGGVPFRKNFAGIGMTYDEKRDAFIDKKIFDSWVFDEETCTWVPPHPKPEIDGVGFVYIWNEEKVNWEKRI